MFRRLVFYCGVPFLVLALYCSLMELGFLDLSKLDSYKLSNLSQLSDKLRYWSSVYRVTFSDFDSNSVNQFMSEYVSKLKEDTNSMTYILGSLLEGVQSLVNSFVHMGATTLLGGAIMIDFINSFISMINMFLDLAYGNISGGLWSNTWSWFESYSEPWTDLFDSSWLAP